MVENGPFVDLHLHSTCSDGGDTPEEIVLKASKLGFSCVSITDHDTCKGYKKAHGAALKHGVELISGIEVSTSLGNRSVHILGYMVNPKSEAIEKIVSTAEKGRLERMKRIVSKLCKLGYRVDIGGVIRFTGEGVLGRFLLAKYLVSIKQFKSTHEVFSKVLGDEKPAFEPVPGFSPSEAIELISEAGGVSSLAHPGGSFSTEEIEGFIKAGLDGIEAFTPHHGPADEQKYMDIASRHNLLVTGGSDSHGNPDYRRQIGSVKLPYRLVESIKERTAQEVTTG
ncbi:FIG00031715: Predicted metal-dependent phosphoesterases (PHP family) [hydrothermal vent metagenome]|uniref:FIG00031715: Predicted metal-dependent phosphoesterases (PHP family) n=1 Tax=hydrothermal vent metagenome TaxID=652676 RepID=A0A3B1D0W9_9ZZZZ